MVPFRARLTAPKQSSSAELEFREFVSYMVQHCMAAPVQKVQKADDAGELVVPDFDLANLEEMIMKNFQKRYKAEFAQDPVFADYWFISKNHLKKGMWKKAHTFARAHEGLKIGHFEGKALPESSVSALGGVPVASWEDLLKNNSKNTYLKTKRTLADYASENKETILGLRGVSLKANAGKVVKVGDRSVYVANVAIDGEPNMVFSFVNQLRVKSGWLD